MSFFAAQLAEDASLETSTATAALLLTTAKAAAGIFVGVATATPGGHVGGGVLSPTTDLDALLVGDQLGVELVDSDGLHACRHRSHHRIEFLIQSG